MRILARREATRLPGVSGRLFALGLPCGVLLRFTIGPADYAKHDGTTVLEQFSSERLLPVSLSSLAVTVASGIHIALATFCLAELYTFRRMRRPAK